MNISVFISLLFALQILYWIVGRRASKTINNKEDYFLAGKSVPLFPLTMTFLATLIGGGLVLGAAEEAYLFGWPVIFYPIGTALGFILLGSGIGRRLAGFQVSTLAQIFEEVYDSVLLKRMASLLSMASLFMILVAQIIGSHKFLVSVGFNNTPLFILFWTIVILYTARGGLKAVISTDVVQALFFSIVFLICFAWVLYTMLYSESSTLTFEIPQLEHLVPVSSKLWGWLLMPLLFIVIEQDIAQRCFAGASAKIVSKASLLAGICMLMICVAPIFFGILAKTMNLAIPPGGSVLITVIAQTTHPWVTAIVGCAILAAVISTATSLINAISSNLSVDFKLSIFEQTDSLRMVQGATCAISIGAIFCAFYFDNVVDMLIQSYELSVSCLFVPIFIALFKKRGNAVSAWSAVLFGAIGFVLFRLCPIAFPREVASVLLSLLGFKGADMMMRRLKSQVNE